MDTGKPRPNPGDMPAKVQATRSNASLVGPDRVVFGIKAKKYRLVVCAVYVRLVCMHGQYDRINAREI